MEQAEKKRGKRQNSEPAACTSRAKCAEKNEEALEEAKTIMSQLESKHEVRILLNSIMVGPNKSVDVPPQYKFFKVNACSSQLLVLLPTHPLRSVPPLRESMLVLNCSIS